MKYVNQPIRKKDAMSLVTGQPVFLEDVVPQDYLVVKLLRSPHANAIIEEINTELALKVEGIEAIYTYKDVPRNRFTLAGQTYPEPSPYDRLILDQHVRYVGDPVAILAGKDEKSVLKAMKLIKVRYKVLEPVLDFHKALDNEILVHPEESWKALCPVGADNRRNLCATEKSGEGDIDQVLSDCDVVVSGTYHTKACQQAMMEPFKTYCSIDTYGRLNVLSSTQIVFHVRRILSNALGIPKSQIRVSKPRIGGGFGAKQTAVSEIYPAFVTWMLKKPSMIVFTREESQIASSPRHEMELSVKVGASKEGKIRGIDVYTLSNTGAYGEHGPTTVGLSGHKPIPLYSSSLEAHRFDFDVVYTNVMSAGAYRGYGATQGIFAVESAVNELAAKLGIDPVKLREMNIVKEGVKMPAYYGEVATSCALDRCLARAKEMIEWDKKYPSRVMEDGKIRSVGVAMAMQGSGISGVDVGSATLKMNEEGYFTLHIAAADMGTGCDTTLAQIAAECLNCSVDNIVVLGADTDSSPYDSGSYASSTAYVTGKAVEKASKALIEKIRGVAAEMLGCSVEETVYHGETVTGTNGRSVTLAEIGTRVMCGCSTALEVTESHTSPTSPPPFMVGMVEIELDPLTGVVKVLDYVAVVDCGTPINPNLTRVQTEGGIAQGIGMALFENITYNEKGKLHENSFMQYKVPTRQDVGRIRVEFESSYEENGPFGAKSIGEVVINTPGPAIAHAIYNATGIWFKELPITPEKIAMAIAQKKK